MSFIEITAVLGNLGEFIGSIAVLATLIYLAVQVKYSRDLLEENRKIALSQVYQARATSRKDQLKMVATSEHIAPVILKYQDQGLASLDKEEQLRLQAFYTTGAVHMDNNLYQGELGLLDADFVQQITNAIVENVPVWLELEVPIPNRLRKFYETHH